MVVFPLSLPLPLSWIILSLDYCSGMGSARGSSDHFRDGCDEFCDADELDDSSSGLSHAGEQHSSSSLDCATACITLSFCKFHLKIGRPKLHCVVQENRLYVAKARGHPLVRVSLGGG